MQERKKERKKERYFYCVVIIGFNFITPFSPFCLSHLSSHFFAGEGKICAKSHPKKSLVSSVGGYNDDVEDLFAGTTTRARVVGTSV